MLTRSKNRSASGAILAIVMVIALTAAAQADTVDVAIQGFAFNPTPLTINAGTSVRWTNMDGAAHTSTSDSPLWDSGNLANGASFVYTFTTPGAFPYHCTIHPTMLATVVVEAASVPSLGVLGAVLLILTLVATAIWVYRRQRVMA